MTGDDPDRGVTRRIRRPFGEASTFVVDPHRILPIISGIGRCEYVGPAEDGEHWYVFLDVGTIHVGGLVLVTHPDPSRLAWRSLRGTEHSFEVLVEPDGDGCRLTLTLAFSLTGFLIGWISEMLGRGVVISHLEGTAEEIRHHLEFEQ